LYIYFERDIILPAIEKDDIDESLLPSFFRRPRYTNGSFHFGELRRKKESCRYDG